MPPEDDTARRKPAGTHHLPPTTMSGTVSMAANADVIPGPRTLLIQQAAAQIDASLRQITTDVAAIAEQAVLTSAGVPATGSPPLRRRGRRPTVTARVVSAMQDDLAQKAITLDALMQEKQAVLAARFGASESTVRKARKLVWRKTRTN